ncbi:MAG: hypothetical protein KDM63_15335, partial [Verrucomicrobiae bacterium]|nr:hypothetical protein [Verrucomicrobiae bacterium]
GRLLGGSSSEDDTERAPLYITSASPPRYRIGDFIRYTFEAIGGEPPYQWTLLAGPAGFQVDQDSGLLTGTAEAPFVATLSIGVRDSLGTEDSALYTLAADDGAPLQIDTVELPRGTVGSTYSATVAASGGLPPYQWTVPSGLPDGFAIDPIGGTLTGGSESGLDRDIELRVTDAGGAEASSLLRLAIDAGIEITTPANLPPASPGSSYSLTFEATGGTAPYAWRLHSGTLPLNPDGTPWLLAPDGQLSGLGSLLEGVHSFVIEVADSQGIAAEKEFRLAVRRLLTVVPSREKAGLAWSIREVEQAIGARIAGVSVLRADSPDPAAPGVLIYQGNGTNLVDRGLVTGGLYTYVLIAHPIGSDPVEAGRTSIQILPFTLGRGVAGRTADPYADAVKAFQPLTGGGHGAAFLPLNVTGPPQGTGTFAPASSPAEVLSLHARAATSLAGAGGSIVLSFEDNIVELGIGEDFTVFENVFFIGGDPDQRFMEPAIVSVALFEGEWHRFPIDVVPPATVSSTPMTMDPYYYNRGFAGRNATTGGTPTDPGSSGGDSFDVDGLGISGLTWIRYVRIQSTGQRAIRDDSGGDWVEHIDLLGSLSGDGSSGFDLDAVSAVHY